MTFTRELLLLAATALAWFAYAVSVSQPDLTDPVIRDICHTSALVLTAVLGVRAGGLIIVEGFIESVWGIQSNALIRLVAYMVLAFLGTALVLKYGLDLNLTTLLTTSALLTAILGFAMQSTLASFFSGLALQLERHIRPGDGILVEGSLATVETIGWRSMTARRPDGSLIMVPNTMIAAGSMPIRRPGELARTEVIVPAPITAPPALVAEILRTAASQLPNIADDQPVSVTCSALSLADGLAHYKVRFFSRPGKPDDSPMEALARLRIWYTFQRHGLISPWFHDVWGAGGLLSHAVTSYSAPLPAHLIDAFAASRPWRSAGDAERERLAGAGRRLLYAPEEPILLPRELDGASAMVVAGALRVSSIDIRKVQGLQPALHQDTDVVGGTAWDSEVLFRVEAELARFIGPYARRATRRIAPEAPDLATLYQRLGELIADEASRDVFLHRVPSQVVLHLHPGSVFVARAHGIAVAGATAPLVALGHVELLAIPAAAMRESPHSVVSAAS